LGRLRTHAHVSLVLLRRCAPGWTVCASVRQRVMMRREKVSASSSASSSPPSRTVCTHDAVQAN